jgi:hypothetical protein
MRLRFLRPSIAAVSAALIVAVFFASTVWAQALPPDAQSRYMPTGPAPTKGYQPYLGPVNTTTETVIGGVPAYLWRHGCGPTAAGMVIGYYDTHGFPLLIPGDASTQTNAVDQAIATGDGAATHYSDYSLPMDSSPNPIQPDLSEPPAGDEHASNSLADFMRTSWSSENNYYGWAWFSHVDDSFEGYVPWAETAYHAHYGVGTFSESWGDFTWQDLKDEINLSRPMVFLVDSDGNGGTDHFVTVIGWRDSNGYEEYGCLDTWGAAIRWERFRAMSSDYSWGVYGAVYFHVWSQNNAPVADAGPDVEVECASHAGTSVMLDGTGSSDADGDPLTYSWSASGITFDDATSATPTATFPLGVTEVTLTVSDGDAEDTDYVTVTVTDTMPPVIACPIDITVECSDYCGTPWDDPQLAFFFTAFSASDVCCATLDIDITRPDCFPLGDTFVTFRATDCSGNSASCSARVRVVDTTPPVIDVTLNRDVLWPPNHKMAEIVATVEVSDICCEGPTFDLVSVTSDEPDNGKGDGNTTGDILVVDKTHIELRSERMGGEDGRVYTLSYLATDCSGNTTPASVEVRVPHDHSGWACASMGFQLGGLAFDPALDRFVLVVRSRPAEFVTGLNGEAVLAAEAFDATALDVTRAYVGNVKDVAIPNESLEIDNNADGLMDLALYYSAPEVNEIIEAAASTENEKMDVEQSYGPIGLHYVSASGVDYLVENIFLLGEPVPLVPPVVMRRVQDPGIVDPPVDDAVRTPAVTTLLPGYPNPFNPTTTIPFQLVSQERVSLRIYDAQGKLVRTLADEVMPAGTHSAVWDGRDNSGLQASTGMYFVRLVAGSYEMTRKVVMIK